VTDHLALEAAGACVVPFGAGNTERLLQTIADLGITAISCAPSYPALLEQILRYLAADEKYTVSLEEFVHRPAG
jgi:phenylacetate-CoA ligase